MQVSIKGNKLTISMDLTSVGEAPLSSTGKTRLVGSETFKGIDYGGQPLRVQVNATIPPGTAPVAK